MNGTVLVGQSGGPTSVINASLVGVIKEALKNTKIDRVLGTFYGIDGIINSNYLTYYRICTFNKRCRCIRRWCK